MPPYGGWDIPLWPDSYRAKFGEIQNRLGIRAGFRIPRIPRIIITGHGVFCQTDSLSEIPHKRPS